MSSRPRIIAAIISSVPDVRFRQDVDRFLKKPEITLAKPP